MEYEFYGKRWCLVCLASFFLRNKMFNNKSICYDKETVLFLFLSFVVVDNIDAQKHKRTMKPKKKEQTEQPCCAEPSFGSLL